MASRKSGVFQSVPQLSSHPATPESGYAIAYPLTDGKWYAKMPDGTVLELTNTGLQPALTDYRVSMWEAEWAQTVIDARAAGPVANLGTVVDRTLTTGGTFLEETKRVGFRTSAAANSACGVRNSAGSLMNGLRGFTYIHRFAFPIYASTQTIFIGPKNGSSALSGSQVPSALVIMCGILKDAGDTNLQFCINNDTGTATKVSTGVTVSTSVVYEMIIVAAPNNASVTITLNNWVTNTQLATHTFTAANTSNNMLPSDSGCSWVQYVSTGAGTALIETDFVNLYLQVPNRP